MDQVVARLAVVASRQHGVLTRKQALEAGCTDAVIGRLVRRGQLVAAHPGVYRMAGVPGGWHTNVMAACLAAGSGALASHLTAAALWQLDGFEQGPLVDVSVAAARRPRVDGVRLHRCRDLEHALAIRRAGIPVTGLARTVLDLAACPGDRQVALRALDAVRRRPHRMSWGALEACAAAIPCGAGADWSGFGRCSSFGVASNPRTATSRVRSMTCWSALVSRPRRPSTR